MSDMRKMIVRLLFLFAAMIFSLASCAADFGIVLRFDDHHAAKAWRELAAVFEASGDRMSIALPAQFVQAEEQWQFLREAAAKGHEIMDHAYAHSLAYCLARDAGEFAVLSRLPFVARCEPDSRAVLFRYNVEPNDPSYLHFRGTITNGILRVPAELSDRFRRPYKVYVPSLKSAFSFYPEQGRSLAREGIFPLHSYWRPGLGLHGSGEVTGIVNEEMILCPATAFWYSDEVLRFQAAQSRKVFERHGLPRPMMWNQPGGWDAYLSAEQFKRIYADEFGYVGADCIAVGRPGVKADATGLKRFMFRPRFGLDNVKSFDELHEEMLSARANGVPVAYISHMQPSPKMIGGWQEWLGEMTKLLAWLKSEGIPVLTMTEAVRRIDTGAN